MGTPEYPAWVTVAREIELPSASRGQGLQHLDHVATASRDADPLFACLAAGTEKLAKLTIGLSAVHAISRRQSPSSVFHRKPIQSTAARFFPSRWRHTCPRTRKRSACGH